MSNSSHNYDDAARLEAALERIASMHRRGVSHEGTPIATGTIHPNIGVVAAKLDHLIADLRQLLKSE